MLRHERNAPIWLFSFVDLAFLLLIAFTQIGPEAAPSAPALGQLEIPRLSTAVAPLSGSEDAAPWQLRVNPVATSERTDSPRLPFELVEPGSPTAVSGTKDASVSSERRIDARELASRLEVLRARRSTKPILAPHRDSRSEDLLVAVGLLESVWQAGRSVAVLPLPPVAAGRGEADEIDR